MAPRASKPQTRERKSSSSLTARMIDDNSVEVTMPDGTTRRFYNSPTTWAGTTGDNRNGRDVATVSPCPNHFRLGRESIGMAMEFSRWNLADLIRGLRWAEDGGQLSPTEANYLILKAVIRHATDWHTDAPEYEEWRGPLDSITRQLTPYRSFVEYDSENPSTEGYLPEIQAVLNDLDSRNVFEGTIEKYATRLLIECKEPQLAAMYGAAPEIVHGMSDEFYLTFVGDPSVLALDYINYPDAMLGHETEEVHRIDFKCFDQTAPARHPFRKKDKAEPGGEEHAV